jgi:hypothetical protein
MKKKISSSWMTKEKKKTSWEGYGRQPRALSCEYRVISATRTASRAFSPRRSERTSTP